MESKHCSSRAFSFARQNERAGFRGALSWNALLGLFGSLLLLSAAIDARSQVILGDGAVVCGLPVIFESICEKKGGGGGLGKGIGSRAGGGIGKRGICVSRRGGCSI